LPFQWRRFTLVYLLMKAISLFSGAGIGDIGLRAANYEFIAFSELEGDRLELIKHNFPGSEFFVGDIWETKNHIIDYVNLQLSSTGEKLGLISCTAPCQGMSKNGQGTLLKNAREGKRPKLDPRNRLIIPALDIIKSLRPEMVIFENVIEMRRTIIEDDDGNLVSILNLIQKKLAPDYVGDAYDVEFADYGIPQRRKRLITVYSRLDSHQRCFHSGGQLVPYPTHSRDGGKGLKQWTSVSEALKAFPPLDAANKKVATNSSVPYHRVPVLDKKKYRWVSNTPPGRSAFDNQCVSCGFDSNPTHSTSKNESGINRASKVTPVYCESCGDLLPRPHVLEKDGTYRIMSGFTSAYKRMSANLPSPTLTRNFSYACSDQKIHPIEHRVLSIAEALKLHTISGYKYEWVKDVCGVKSKTSDALIRLVIGESIPPLFMELLGNHLNNIRNGDFIF